ncbi:family 78 glycoside hydrolase catalytic domain [Vibrio splendidus]|uniref:alpha-L-rhamnosidase-related protein n=1 Tax=Vibrio splendidus TaxID=29497 RepID=UPI000300EC20|nr:family 78 glycoside hydrolase catalytic domain [Vibrio splendidus]
MFTFFRKRKLSLLLAILIVTLLVLFFVEAKRAVKKNGELVLDPISRAELESLPQQEKVLKGMVLKKHSATKVEYITPKKCLLSFDKTWFGNVEVIATRKNHGQRLEVVLGEQRDGKRVYDSLKQKKENIAYAKTTVEVSDKIGDASYANLPRRRIPGGYELPFDLKGVVPFRYVEVLDGCYEGIENDVYQVALTYDFPRDSGYFKSGEYDLNRVYDLTRHTILATSFAGMYVDGYREILPYEADAYINQLGGYAIDSDPTLTRRTQDHLLNKGTWPTEWIMHSIFIAYTDYLYTGDLEYLSRHYLRLKARALVDLANSDYLISSSNQTPELLESIGYQGQKITDIVDWPISERDNFATIDDRGNLAVYYSKLVFKKLRLAIVELFPLPNAAVNYRLDLEGYVDNSRILPEVNSVVNAFHFSALKKMSYLANELGYDEDAQFFSDRAKLVERSYHRLFIDNKTGLVKDAPWSEHSSQQSNVFALRFGLIPEKHVADVLDSILSDRSGSVYLYQYFLEALYENGKQNEAFEIITSSGNRSWLGMMDILKSTMTTESWNFKVKPDMDLNHAWGTAPLNIISRYLVGIRPIEPGFRKFSVFPRDDKVDYYESIVPTLNGDILFNKTKLKNTINYRLEFDGDMSAQMALNYPGCNNVMLSTENNVSYYKGGRAHINNIGPGKHVFQLSCRDGDR